ncbi:hypothetical protein [Photobacterium sp. OFAV2-7]|uniref:hypothetical protein n=1 Tax=Photobacterium sp. OFAV2-7 TaxID=2917748 RepID=UPI001EF4BE3A|nr:hypothetical protein [Photobacterium sp. OFAV2-7]MCG7586748.1 hypothetical protein [Photobacterium sp. OFAV2-7]
MATIKAPSMADRIYIGAAGNLSVAESKVVLAGAAVNDVVEMVEMPIGLKVVGLRIVTDGLGNNVTVDIKAGNTVLKAGVDVATANATIIPIVPAYLDEKVPLTATIKGAPATGELAIMPEYTVIGY